MKALLVPFLFTGCILWVPVHARTPHGLRQLRQPDQLATVLPVGMSREDVLGTLGVPDRVLDDGNRLLWVASSHVSSLVVILPNAAGGMPLGHDYALLLGFDDAGCLVERTLSRTCYGDWPRLVARMVGDAAP